MTCNNQIFPLVALKNFAVSQVYQYLGSICVLMATWHMKRHHLQRHSTEIHWTGIYWRTVLYPVLYPVGLLYMLQHWFSFIIIIAFWFWHHHRQPVESHLYSKSRLSIGRLLTPRAGSSRRLRLLPTPADHCDLIKQPYATAQSEASIRLCDRSAPFPRKEGRERGGRGCAVGVMCAGDTVKPSGKSFVTSRKRASTLWFLTASVGHTLMTVWGFREF